MHCLQDRHAERQFSLAGVCLLCNILCAHHHKAFQVSQPSCDLPACRYVKCHTADHILRDGNKLAEDFAAWEKKCALTCAHACDSAAYQLAALSIAGETGDPQE